MYAAWFEQWFKHEKRLLASAASILYFALFATSDAAPIAALAQLLASLAQAAAWDRNAGEFGAASFLVASAGLAAADRLRRPLLAGVAFAAFCLSFGAWISGFPGSESLAAFAVVTVMFLLFFGWLPWRVWRRKAELTRYDLAVAALNGILYFAAGYGLLNADYHAWMGLFAVAVAAAHLSLAYGLWLTTEAGRRDPRAVLLTCGVALGLLILAAPIQFTGFRITMAWAMEGAALAWIAARTESRKTGFAALLVFFLVFLRLLAIDSAMYPSPRDYAALLNTRFLTFVTAAAASLLGARWFRAGPEALATYLGGHFSLLFGLGLEVAGWARRSSPQEASLESVSVSILTAAYGVALIALGVSTKTLVNRLLGLGLLALVILKLYLLDVWEMSRLYRIVAFGGLGILMLSASYLYSRYREKIEGLIQGDHRQ